MNKPINSDDQLLTVKQVADLLQVHPQTVYAWKDDPKIGLPCVRLGRSVRFVRGEVLAWANRNGRRLRHAQV